MDFAVRLGRLHDATLVAIQLFRLRYRCVASPAYLDRRGVPDAPCRLAEHACLTFPLRDFGRVWRFRREVLEEVPVRGPLVASNTLALREAAIAGLGISVLPTWLVDDALGDGRLVELFDDHQITLTTFDAAVWLVFPARRYIPARVRAVTDFLRANL